MPPKKMLIVASVTMKLCRRVLMTIRPLMAPSNAPMPTPTRMAMMTGNPTDCAAQPMVIAAETPMAPTARFSPPVTSTTIIEKPMTVSIAMVRLSA